jgi:RNA polymerase primary sigma factor
MTPEERQDVLHRARRLAAEGAAFADVIKKLVAVTGRSGETLRSLLKRFDREHPAQAVFPDHSGELRPESRRKILQLHEQGETLDALARRFRRSRSYLGRILQQARLERIGELSLDCIANSQFATVKTGRAEREIVGEMPAAAGPAGHRKPPRDLPPYLARLYEIPLLTHEQERHLFRKMNYLKYKAARLRAALDPVRPNPGVMDRIERLHRQAVDVKNQIVSANLRLVVSIAKRHAGHNQDFFELVSDGNISLMRAVEKYDFARGFKFSTYASWAIMKNYSRSIPDEQQRRRRYSTGATEALAVTEDRRSDQHDMEVRQTRREAAVERILRRLDAREKEIIAHRFGLHGEQWLTLKQVGGLIGVTKERARQLEARAISKLRQAAQEEHLPVEEWVEAAQV